MPDEHQYEKTEQSQSQHQERDEGILPNVDSEKELLVEIRWAIVGGSVAGIVGLAGSLSVGHVTGAEAYRLVQGLLPTARFMSSGVMAAAATILALMLTLLGISRNTTSQLKVIHYRRIRRVSLLTVISLIASIIQLSFLVIPLQETEAVPTSWYNVLYYTLLFASALLGSLITTVVLMLYSTITGLIELIEPTEQKGPLAASEAE